MITKYCPGCKQELPIYEFNRNRTRPDGLQPLCRNCHNGKRRVKRTNSKIVPTPVYKARISTETMIQWRFNEQLNLELAMFAKEKSKSPDDQNELIREAFLGIFENPRLTDTSNFDSILSVGKAAIRQAAKNLSTVYRLEDEGFKKRGNPKEKDMTKIYSLVKQIADLEGVQQSEFVTAAVKYFILEQIRWLRESIEDLVILGWMYVSAVEKAEVRDGLHRRNAELPTDENWYLDRLVLLCDELEGRSRQQKQYEKIAARNGLAVVSNPVKRKSLPRNDEVSG